ncbi:MAG: Kelch repeat-containing protein [Anaerolineae bacterium]
MAAEYGESLTDRELEITDLVAEGLTNREIAARLFLSPNTVKVHLRNIFTKTGVSSRTELSMLAIQEGWISVPGMVEGTAPDGEEESEETPTSPLLPDWPWQRWSILTAGLVLALVILFLPQRPSSPASAAGPGEVFGATEPVSPIRAPALEDGWEELPPQPVRRAGMATAAYQNKIYVIGGMTDEGASDHVDIYDVVSQSWQAGPPRPSALAHVKAVEIDGEILVPGGCDAEWTPQANVHLYNPEENLWYEAAPLPTPLCAYALAAYQGQAYLFGGWDGEAYRTLAYTYHPDQDTWRPIQQPEQARGFGDAAALIDQIFYVGGYDRRRELATCEVYSPEGDQWQACNSMLQPRGGLGLVSIGGRVYAIGGGWQTPLGFSERYTPDTDEWSVVETPVVGEWRNLSAVAWETSIYAIGGWNGTGFLNRTYTLEVLPWRVFIPGTLHNP